MSLDVFKFSKCGLGASVSQELNEGKSSKAVAVYKVSYFELEN